LAIRWRGLDVGTRDAVRAGLPREARPAALIDALGAEERIRRAEEGRLCFRWAIMRQRCQRLSVRRALTVELPFKAEAAVSGVCQCVSSRTNTRRELTG
jgi:hypothetical protein